MQLLLPWPPSVNSLYCQGPTHGQKFLTKKGREYKQALCQLYANDDLDPYKDPLTVTIGLFPPDSRTRDLDNYIKPILDGLKWLEIIEDDSIIHQVMIEKGKPLPHLNKGGVVIRLQHYYYDSTVNYELVLKKYLDKFDDTDKLLFHKPTKKELKKDASDK